MDVNNLYGLAMSQKLPVNKSEWTQETSKFSENIIKNYNEESEEGYFFWSWCSIPRKITWTS